MKKIIAPVIILILIFSMGVYATNDKQKQERVLSDDTSEGSIEFFEKQGCVVKHILKNKIAYSCPEDIVEMYELEEDEIYELKDSVSVSQINADKVWLEGYNGTGVKVAILDTGIDENHPEFGEGDIVAQWDFVDEDGVAEDTIGHGTHVAGIITANGENPEAKGAAPKAEIMVGKVCSLEGCYNSDIQAGIEWAVANNADIISMSLGSRRVYRSDCDYTDLAIASNETLSEGVVVVAASGNDGRRGVSSPGCASGVIAVGAVDDNDNVAYFSNYGSSLDVVAPGVSVYSTMPTYEVYYNTAYGYSLDYASMSGTSMATPYTAATIALILEAHSDYNVSDVKESLYNTAITVYDRKDGNGRIDALAAVNYVIGEVEDPIDPPEEEPNCPPGLAKKGLC